MRAHRRRRAAACSDRRIIRSLPAPSEPPRAPWALTAWYAATTGSLALGPWLAVLLIDAGWTAAEASLLLVALPIGRLVGVPAWAWIADRRGADAVVRGTMVAGVAACGLLWAAAGPWPVFVAVVAWALARAPAFPLVDATTVALVGRGYGRVRAAGSVVFLFGAAANGFLRDAWPDGPVAVATALALLGALATFRLPPMIAVSARADLAALAGLLRHRVLVPLALVAVLHGASLSAYDALFAVHVDVLGLPSAVTGAGVAVAVACEVVVLALGERLLAAFGPATLFVIGVVSGVPRLLGMALTTDPVALVAIQSLHALSFGAFWIAGTALFAEHAPRDLRFSAQALLPAAMFGAGPLVGLGASAVILRHETPAAVFLGMAGVSAVAAVVAVVAARR